MDSNFSDKNFFNKDLQGRSFKGQDLAGVNFSYAKIQGANFAGANLQDANFFHARAGLEKHWAWILTVAWIILAFIESNITKTPQNYYLLYKITSWLLLILLVTTAILLLWRGIVGNKIGTTAVTIFVNLIIVVALAIGISVFLDKAGLGFIGILLIPVLGSGVCLILFRAVVVDDEKFAPIRNVYIAINTIRGTSFRGADLTNTDFTAAILKNADFRQATLIKTCFRNARFLDFVMSDHSSYLQIKQLRELIVKGDVKNKNFDGQNLEGINLKGVSLSGASFIGTKLSNANLQKADLSQAKLVRAQVDGTDFTGAILTGAVIQDWNITTTTRFDGVECKKVYMRQPTTDNLDPHRKPDNRQEEFADGDFGNFIKPIFDTLDLYHSQGVDPRAIAISIKELAENHPDAQLKIVSMELRGEDDGFMVRMQTAPEADKSPLSAEYRDSYEKYRGLSAQELKLSLTYQDSEIQRLANMLTTALQQPNFSANNNIQHLDTMTNNPGGFSMGNNRGNINNVQGDGNRTIQGDNNQAILGDRNQVDQSTTSESNLNQAQFLQQLANLIGAIEGADLPTDTKTEIVEDLTAVQTAIDKPKPNKPRALDRLSSAASSIEKTSKTLEAGQKIWAMAKPIILSLKLLLSVNS
jgi:uncharacterized protein YjbI with pentapeptide repeats